MARSTLHAAPEITLRTRSVLNSGGRAGAVATGYRYDAYNRPNLTIYPDGEQVTVEYNSMGLPARLTSSTQGVLVNGLAVGGASAYTVQYDAAGRAVKTKYAAGGDLWRTQTFAPFTAATQGGLLTAIDVGTQAAPGALLHLGYVYDEFGNTGTITETTTANVLSYDGQSRVTQAFGASYSYQPSGRFDRFVGLAFAYGTGQAAGSNRSPLHGVVSTGAGGVFTYDANGNMVSRKTTSTAPVQTLAWSGANELLSVTAGATMESYRYDEEGARIYQESRTSGALTWQQFDYFPHYTVKVAGSTTTATKYYFFGGQRIAQKVGDATLTYLHGDHLGSTVLTTGVSGNQKYHAYGALRSGGVQSDYQFTGQEADSGTGLIYMRARYYDPVIGQFISPDTIVPDPTNVHAYNRYMYAYGNPLRYTDPTGHYSNEEIMEHFDCHDWECVMQVFGSGGPLAGLGGWLNILELAQDGDSVAALNFQQMPGGGSTAASLMGTFMRQGSGRGSIQVQVTGFGSPDGATVAYSGGVMSSDAFAAFAGNSAIHGGYTLAGQIGSASFSRGVYQQGVCDIWDCTEIGLTALSLGASALQTGAGACTIATFGACAPALGGITGFDASLQALSIAHSGVQYAQGKDSAFDLSLSLAQSALSVTPIIGVPADAVWLLYELADPILPTERWGAVKGVR